MESITCELVRDLWVSGRLQEASQERCAARRTTSNSCRRKLLQRDEQSSGA